MASQVRLDSTRLDSPVLLCQQLKITVHFTVNNVPCLMVFLCFKVHVSTESYSAFFFSGVLKI